jgi:hypothetical protein
MLRRRAARSHTISVMTQGFPQRRFRAKAWTWLEPDAQPDAPHLTVDPNEQRVFPGGPDEEGRFVVHMQHENGPTHWVGDRRHWTEVPPKP